MLSPSQLTVIQHLIPLHYMKSQLYLYSNQMLTSYNTMNKEQMINRSMVSTGSLPSINLVADDSVNLSSSSTASAIEQKLDSLHDLLQNQSFNKPADVQGTVSNPYSVLSDDADLISVSSLYKLLTLPATPE